MSRSEVTTGASVALSGVGDVNLGAGYLFGPFRLMPRKALLLENDQTIRLGTRALAILVALVERAGELVTKQELMDAVWPTTTVTEANLTVHMVALRRALGQSNLGERYIINIPGRGYQFSAHVTPFDEDVAQAVPVPNGRRADNLPAQLTYLVGRAPAIQHLAERLKTQRLLTITGAGGMGKTALALHLAANLVGQRPDGVWLIDLALIADPDLVPTALASVLGLEVNGEAPVPNLLAELRPKDMLLVFDNCEHVIDAAASLIGLILKAAPKVQILATSREALRVSGEHTWRLPPLESPPADTAITAMEALSFPAVQLFTQRAAAALNDFELADADAPTISLICRELDGVPLAIEFAAACMDAFGAKGIASGLDNRLSLLTLGRRDVSPRHRTIGAVLDWSYDLLPEADQRLFRYLAIFAGGFSLESAEAVASDVDDVSARIADLVLKSLVSADVTDAGTRFRLLETTRTYAAAKLKASGDQAELARRHAQYFRDRLVEARRAESDGKRIVSATQFAADIDNVRAALTWSLSPAGDLGVAATLGAASATFWLNLSLIAECHSWMSRIFAALGPEERSLRAAVAIGETLSSMHIFTQGNRRGSLDRLDAELDEAEQKSDPVSQANLLFAMWAHRILIPEYAEAVRIHQKHRQVSEKAPVATKITTNNYMHGTTAFFIGNHAVAQHYLGQFLEEETPELRRKFINVAGYDRRSASMAKLAFIDWLQGRSRDALRNTELAFEEARANGPLAVCEVLVHRALLTFYVGNEPETAARDAHDLVIQAKASGLRSHQHIGEGISGLIGATGGDANSRQSALAATVAGLKEVRSETFSPVFIGETALLLASRGEIPEAWAFIAQTGAAGEDFQCWCGPELLRLKGEIRALEGDNEAAAALFRTASHLARQQGAKAWELRIACSHSALLLATGRRAEATRLLSEVRQTYLDDSTADLRWADSLLAGDAGAPKPGSRSIAERAGSDLLH